MPVATDRRKPCIKSDQRRFNKTISFKKNTLSYFKKKENCIDPGGNQTLFTFYPETAVHCVNKGIKIPGLSSMNHTACIFFNLAVQCIT